MPDEPSQFKSFRYAVDDPTLLVAKGKFSGNKMQQKRARDEHVDKLSRAILKVIASHTYAHVRSVGRDATLNAISAIEQASTLCRTNTGVRLYNEIQKDRGNLGELRDHNHIRDIEAWLFTVAFFKKENSDANA